MILKYKETLKVGLLLQTDFCINKGFHSVRLNALSVIRMHSHLKETREYIPNDTGWYKLTIYKLLDIGPNWWWKCRLVLNYTISFHVKCHSFNLRKLSLNTSRNNLQLRENYCQFRKANLQNNVLVICPLYTCKLIYYILLRGRNMNIHWYSKTAACK